MCVCMFCFASLSPFLLPLCGLRRIKVYSSVYENMAVFVLSPLSLTIRSHYIVCVQYTNRMYKSHILNIVSRRVSLYYRTQIYWIYMLLFVVGRCMFSLYAFGPYFVPNAIFGSCLLQFSPNSCVITTHIYPTDDDPVKTELASRR